jgi:hypothetical protein
MRREKTQMSKIINAKGEITTNHGNPGNHQSTLRAYTLINLKILKIFRNLQPPKTEPRGY